MPSVSFLLPAHARAHTHTHARARAHTHTHTHKFMPRTQCLMFSRYMYVLCIHACIILKPSIRRLNHSLKTNLKVSPLIREGFVQTWYNLYSRSLRSWLSLNSIASLMRSGSIGFFICWLRDWRAAASIRSSAWVQSKNQSSFSGPSVNHHCQKLRPRTWNLVPLE